MGDAKTAKAPGGGRFQRASPGVWALCLAAMTLLFLGVLASRTLSVGSWDAGMGQVGRWVETGVFLAMGAWGALRRPVGGRALLVATVALQVLCIASALLYMETDLLALRLVSIGSHCISLATGMLGCAWVVARLPGVPVAAFAPAAFALANLCNAALGLLGDRESAKIVASVGLCASMAVLAWLSRFHDDAAGGARRASGKRAAVVLASVVVISAIYGLLAQVGGTGAATLSSQSIALARCAVLMGLAALCWFGEGRLAADRLFIGFVPIVSTVVLAFPVIGMGESGAYRLLLSLASVAFQAMLWAYALSVSRRLGADATLAVFGLVFGCQHVSMLLGRQFGASLAHAGVDTARVVLVVAWALSIAAFVCYRVMARPGARGEQSAGPVVPSSPMAPSEQAVAGPFESACRRWGLSPREAEVLGALAAGRSRAEIAQSMGIEEETVKTYVRRLYRKADVHSHRELLAALDGVEQS